MADSKNHFTLYIPQEERRRFQDQTVCRLKIAVVHGKLLVTGSEEIVAECRKRYADVTGEWFFDIKRFRELEELLAPFGLRIAQVHPFSCRSLVAYPLLAFLRLCYLPPGIST